MKRLNKLSETDFLKLFFLFLSTCFLVGAVCMPDRGEMLSGLWKILASTCKISTNYFAVGGFAATFLNMSLLGFVLTGLYHFLKAPVNNVSTLAFVLTLGFGSWGINVLNLWFSVLGVVLYAAVKREKLSGHVNAILFSTGIAPLISEMLFRYPHAEALGFHWAGLGLAVLVGVCIGFFLPAGLAYSFTRPMAWSCLRLPAWRRCRWPLPWRRICSAALYLGFASSSPF